MEARARAQSREDPQVREKHRSEMENLRRNKNYREEENRRARESYEKAFEALSLKEEKGKLERHRDADRVQLIHKVCNAREFCTERSRADGKGYDYHMRLYQCRLFRSNPKEAEKFSKDEFLFRTCPDCNRMYDDNRCGAHPDGCLPSHCTLECENCQEAQGFFFGPHKTWIDMMVFWEEIRKTEPYFVEISHPPPEELAEMVYAKREQGKADSRKKNGVISIQSLLSSYRDDPDGYERWSKEKPIYHYVCKEQDGNSISGPAAKCHHPNWTCAELREGKH